jgi:hypothetical protein
MVIFNGEDCARGNVVLPKMSFRYPARLTYVALAVGTIASGLVVHLRGGVLDATTRDSVGDALWAAMMVWWVRVIAPAARPRTGALVALAICFGVEFSQLYHAPALDALRGTAAGHLVLGSGFDPRDLAAYAAGILAAVLLDHAVVRRGRRLRTAGQETRRGDATSDLAGIMSDPRTNDESNVSAWREGKEPRG